MNLRPQHVPSLLRTCCLAAAWLASTLCLGQAGSGGGYVFTGDLNHDGIADKIVSGPATLFGNGGGPFVVSIGTRKGPPKQFVLALHPLAVTVENASTGLRIWSYWHLSASEGELCVDTLSDQPTRRCITIYPGADGTELGRALSETLFAKGRTLVFQKVTDYVPPPRPDGREWGK